MKVGSSSCEPSPKWASLCAATRELVHFFERFNSCNMFNMSLAFDKFQCCVIPDDRLRVMLFMFDLCSVQRHRQCYKRFSLAPTHALQNAVNRNSPDRRIQYMHA